MQQNFDLSPAKPSTDLTPQENAIIGHALAILTRTVFREEFKISSPVAVKQFLTLKMARLEYEVFTVLWFDVKHRLITAEDMSRGTLTHCSVYTRELVRSAVAHNAACCIFAHCHPSGVPDPSEADHRLTKAARDVLSMVDVRVLDHIIVAGTATYSFAENGLI